MELWGTIIGALITAVATVTSVWLGHIYVKRKRQNPVAEDTAQSANVYTAIKFTLEEMKADRAYVLQFHNGGQYYSGRGQQKYSCTHEIAADGISHECDHSQNHRVSNHHSYIRTLIEEERYCPLDTALINDNAFSHNLRLQGVKSLYNVPIKTLNGKIIGILGVDYVKKSARQKDFNKDTFLFMKKQARIIAGYLV